MCDGPGFSDPLRGLGSKYRYSSYCTYQFRHTEERLDEKSPRRHDLFLRLDSSSNSCINVLSPGVLI